jgi:hypothetical protein
MFNTGLESYINTRSTRSANEPKPEEREPEQGTSPKHERPQGRVTATVQKREMARRSQKEHNITTELGQKEGG